MTSSSIGVCLRITAFGDKGGRKYMEDFFSVAYQQSEDLTDLEFAFFGIFDGHGGAEAAKFAKEHLMNNILAQKGFYSDDDDEVLKAIKEGYIATHLAMWKNLDKWPKTASGLPSTAGTTASVAFIRRGKIYIGHVGDSGIVLGIENNDEKKTWRAQQLTEDHKPESVAEQERISNSGGKVIVKSGVPRVVWNRPRIGHKGPIRRSTPIDEIPFLAVARSLGDLWSYNSALNEFVVSPEPDVHVVKIDPNTFKCLIFGTDGLWNVLSAEGAVELVRHAEHMNNSSMSGVSHDWKNPSRCLVESALQNWNKTKMRADNTSVVTIMLDPPNKKNLLKICQTPVNLNQSTATTATASEPVEDRNAAIYDYNTREAYDLESFSSRNQMTSAIAMEQEHQRMRNYCPMYDTFSSPQSSPSTSHHYPSQPESYLSTPEYSLTKLQSRHERETNGETPYHPMRHLSYHFGPGSSATSTPAPPSYHQETNVLPSIHNFVNDHHHFTNKFNMERFDYMNYNHYHQNHHVSEEVAYHGTETYQDPLEIPENQEKSTVDVAETSGDDITDNSIQINEVSSSLADETAAPVKLDGETKEEADETTKKSLKKSRNSSSHNQTAKKRIFYETRLTKCKTRACNSTYSQKSLSALNSCPKVRKVMRKKPVVMAMAIAKKLEAAIEATTATIGKLRRKNVAKNKENHVDDKGEKSLRNSIRISNKQNLPLNEKVTKVKVENSSLKRRASQENPRACKLRKLK